MRKILLSVMAVLLAAGLLAPGAAAADPAQGAKPVAVLSLAGYDEMKADLDLVGKLAEDPGAVAKLEAFLNLVTNNKLLAGLDKKRPWGAVVQADADRISGYGFLPVSDLSQLLALVEPHVGKPKDLGNGVFEFQAKGKTVCYKEKDGWLLLAKKPEDLATTADPKSLLGGLNEKYDLAVRLLMANVPPKHRERLLAEVKKHGEKHLNRWPHEGDQEHALRRKAAERMFQSLTKAVDELDQVTLGWSLDHHANKAFLELTATARPGTKLAGQMAELAKVKTGFGGFRVADAAVTANWAGTCPLASPEDRAAGFQILREKLFQGIEGHQHAQKHADVLKEVVGKVLDVAEQTAAAGHVDGGAAVILKPDAATLLFGGYVADGAKLEDAVKQLAEAARKEKPEEVEKLLKLDAGQAHGVRFHTITIPVPAGGKDRDKAVKVVGESLQIVLGFGPKAVYLAAGKDAMKDLQQAIEQSEKTKSQTVPPVQVSVSLDRMARFAAAVGKEKDQAKAAKAAELLEKTPGKDHVTLVATPIERGVTWRLEFEEGALKLMAMARKLK